MSYTGAVPDTLRPTDWQTSGACRTEDPDLFFPTGNTGPALRQIEAAKAVCRRCPVLDQCLQWALDNRPSNGIFAAITEQERRSARRRQQRGRITPLASAPPAPPPRTLAEAFARRSKRTEGGHILWYGSAVLKFAGRRYTALQVAFIVGRGREPEGSVRRTCGAECFRADHLTDAVIRDSDAVCGTRPGYQRHRRRGEVPCAGCRRANTSADNQLRRTGTTRVSA